MIIGVQLPKQASRDHSCDQQLFSDRLWLGSPVSPGERCFHHG